MLQRLRQLKSWQPQQSQLNSAWKSGGTLFSFCNRLLSTDGGESTISIDRSALYQDIPHSHGHQARKEPESAVVSHLKSLIRFRGGPITVAEYMSEVLTNPIAGYYVNRDVFGTRGDFITSPEISQLFGEMVGIWCVYAWQQHMGRPSKLRLVELGPGRGTLMADLLRGTTPFRQFAEAVSVHMVEVSPHLRQMQQKALGCSVASSADDTSTAFNGSEVRWHRSLEEISRDVPTIYIAHEFLDALPVNQFQRTDRGWRERLVDLDQGDSPLHLRFVMAPGRTPASIVLDKRLLHLKETGSEYQEDQLEISPQSMAITEDLALRVAEHGGAALIMDYGDDKPYKDSLQAIRKHMLMPLLSQPGDADLSAWVDFSSLRQVVQGSGGKAQCYGPVPQGDFLHALGIQHRLQALLEQVQSDEEGEALIAGYHRLVTPSAQEQPRATAGAEIEASASVASTDGGQSAEASGLQSGAGEAAGTSNETVDGMGTAYKVFVIVPSASEVPLGFEPPAKLE